MKRLLLLLFILSGMYQVKGQHAYSEDRATFYRQVLSNLQSLGTEPAKKVAFDFGNAWNGKFTDGQKDQIHKIARDMYSRGYKLRPHFWYYFSYLAFADAQAHLQSDQVTQLLKINEQMVQELSWEEYTNFLLGLNMYMARRILAKTNNVYTVTDEGSYAFAILSPDETSLLQEATQDAGELAEEPDQNNQPDDSWGDNDTANNDPWGDNAPSGDDWGNDPWEDNNDNWDTQGGYQDNWVEQENTWGYDVSGQVFEEKSDRHFVEAISQDHVANIKANYQHPYLVGPSIELTNNSMLFSTPYDSLSLRETSGSYLLKTRTYAAKNAKLSWPSINANARGAQVSLGQFYVLKDRAEFWSPNATLSFETLFSGTLEGVFTYKSIPRKKNTPSTYPIFTSYRADVDINIPDPRVKYRGGIEIHGNSFVGTSASRKPGTLTVLDGKGHHAVLRGHRFEFRPDSSIYSPSTSVALMHGGDSLTHPAVEMFYYPDKGELVLLRTDKFDLRPFYSTYFKVNVNAEVIKWRLDDGMVDFNIMNGKDLVPMTIESKDFFNAVRFSKLEANLPFHPVNTSVYFANKYNTDEFADIELSEHFNVKSQYVKSAMRVLAAYGFAEYDEESGIVKLRDKAFHYFKASGGKIDYDNYMIPSVSPEAANASWALDSGTLKVNGVDRFYLTPDFKVYAEPDSQTITLLEDRAILMNGMINAGDFQYKGKNYHFDYDGFLIHMDSIDSISIHTHALADMSEGGSAERSALNNHLNQTSGTLYLDDPTNKSGRRYNPNYPDFTTESEAVVYFDGPEILGGAYDRSVKFIIPPFESDSLNDDSAISFEGNFNSGGIFPTFEETLKLQPDRSLGFTHTIPSEGYQLYGTEARTYEKIQLNSQGIRGGGKIDFITSTIYSKDFVYFPDSVIAYGTGGVIGPGEVKGASYPEAKLGAFRMHWEPRIDSMYLRNIRAPFKFYNATAELDGAVNITSKGVFGVGTMLTRGSRAVSKDMKFKQYSYSARHAGFEVLTDNPNKPAMAGDDISLNFDLVNATAVIKPERAGVASISFPYAQMNTSITEAIWDLEDSVVTMTKPANVPIESSYFYSTRQDLDSLAFSAQQAIYDFNSKELNIKGIPYIKVADALIIPENNETTILENSELEAFNNAQLIMDTVNQYHYLRNGRIKIVSRNEFNGVADYRLITGLDTFYIKFDRFVLDDVYLNQGDPERMTISGGEILGEQNVKIDPGFFYRGEVKMYAKRQALELHGAVKLSMVDHAGSSNWLLYNREVDDTKVKVKIGEAYFYDEEPVIAGLHYDVRGNLYSTFVDKRKNGSDEDFFLSKGILEYLEDDKSYRIEDPAKTSGAKYGGYTMIYNNDSKDIVFEGPANFFNKFTKKVTVNAAVLGTGNVDSSKYKLDAFLAIDFDNAQSFMPLMAADLSDIVERLGPPLANDISNVKLLYKLADMTSDKLSRAYEVASLKNYKPMHGVSENLIKSLVISGVKMEWSQKYGAWYNTTKLAISNIYESDINAKLDGFIEMRKDESNNDVLNLFIQAAPETWYFISYESNNLMMYSSNEAFNEEVSAKSNFGRGKANDLILVLGDESETLSFVNEFRERYFGIAKPYNLVVPDEVSLEDEEIETIEKEKPDDGFGF